MSDEPRPPDQPTERMAPTAPAPPPPAPVAPGPSRGAALLSGGWGTALGWAVLTFVVMALLGEGLFGLIYASNPGSLGVADVVKIGGLFTYAFHRVGVVAELPSFSIPGGQSVGLGGGISVKATLAFALLLGTAVLVLLLYRGGRAIAARAGEGPGWVRGLHGAKIALPYALLTLAVSFALSFTVPIPAVGGLTQGGALSIHPSYLAAVGWPFVLALLFGFAGGVRSGARDGWTAMGAWGRRVGGALTGGWRMVVWGLVLSFVGLLVHAAVTSDATRAYFDGAFSQGALAGIALIVLNLFVVPNMAAFVLAPAMGSSLGLYGGGGGLDILSYFHFPTGINAEALGNAAGLGGLSAPPADLIRHRIAPWPYFLFLLVPLLAVLIGGRLAARRAEAATRQEGAGVGALAGVWFAVVVLVLSILAGFGFRFVGGFAGFNQSSSAHLGPVYLLTLLLALAWGVIGGAIGGASRRPPPVIAPAITATPMATEPIPAAPPGTMPAPPSEPMPAAPTGPIPPSKPQEPGPG